MQEIVSLCVSTDINICICMLSFVKQPWGELYKYFIIIIVIMGWILYFTLWLTSVLHYTYA